MAANYGVVICAGIGLCCAAVSADAVQKPKLHQNDSRIWEFTYTPDDIYKVWSAPGSVLLIRFAPDELILIAQAADVETIKDTHSDNLLTLKFAGCALPEPLFVATRKMTTEETRTYAFSIETVPVVCATTVPQEPPVASPNIANAAYNDGPARLNSPDAVPNLKHLAHPNDLAEGGTIPFMITFKYPSDEKAKREAAAEKEAKRFATKQTRQILDAAAAGKARTTQFENNHYYGRGDQDLKPCLPPAGPDGKGCGPFDDGNTTRILFPGDTPVPAVTKLPTATAACRDGGGEAVADYAMHGKTMVINGTAPGWCLRRDGRVYQLNNASYNPVGYPTGTGTVSPYVERVIKEP